MHGAKQQVERKPQAQIGDHADNRGGHQRQRALEQVRPFQPFEPRCERKHPQKARRKRDPGGQQRAQQPGDQRGERCGRAGCRQIADKLRDHDQRAGRGFGQPQPVGHFGRGQPVLRAHRLLRHIGEHGIGAAERDHRQLGKKHPDLPQHVMRAERGEHQPHRRRPDRAADQHRAHAVTPRAPRKRGGRWQRTQPEHGRTRARHQPAQRARADHHQRKRPIEHEQRNQRRNGHRALERGVERAARQPHHRLRDDRQHRRLDPRKQRDKPAQLRGKAVKHRQRQDHQRARNDEQQPRDQPAAHAVQAPADPDRQLLRLGPGQQIAEIERVEKLVFADPPARFDQFTVHQRDLPRRPAKAEAADPRRHAHQIGNGGGRSGGGRGLRSDGHQDPSSLTLRGVTRQACHRPSAHFGPSWCFVGKETCHRVETVCHRTDLRILLWLNRARSHRRAVRADPRAL
jgi:hypothetical protein